MFQGSACRARQFFSLRWIPSCTATWSAILAHALAPTGWPGWEAYSCAALRARAACEIWPPDLVARRRLARTVKPRRATRAGSPDSSAAQCAASANVLAQSAIWQARHMVRLAVQFRTRGHPARASQAGQTSRATARRRSKCWDSLRGQPQPACIFGHTWRRYIPRPVQQHRRFETDTCVAIWRVLLDVFNEEAIVKTQPPGLWLPLKAKITEVGDAKVACKADIPRVPPSRKPQWIYASQIPNALKFTFGTRADTHCVGSQNPSGRTGCAASGSAHSCTALQLQTQWLKERQSA